MKNIELWNYCLDCERCTRNCELVGRHAKSEDWITTKFENYSELELVPEKH